MPYDDPDATDPMTLQGVVIETDNDDAMRDMAECFIEEYIRTGFDAQRILKMFKTRGYAGPALAYQTLGEATIINMIDELMALWGGRTGPVTSVTNANGDVSLPILEG